MYKQWEYLEVEMALDVDLNKYGLQGWELVAVIGRVSGNTNDNTAFFKREIMREFIPYRPINKHPPKTFEPFNSLPDYTGEDLPF